MGFATVCGDLRRGLQRGLRRVWKGKTMILVGAFLLVYGALWWFLERLRSFQQVCGHLHKHELNRSTPYGFRRFAPVVVVSGKVTKFAAGLWSFV